MMKKKFVIIGIVIIVLASVASFAIGKGVSNAPDAAYTIYNANGNKVSFQEMLSSVSQADVCFFGEYHNDPISHWMELRVLEGLYGLRKDLTFGGEMWERDQQDVMDECMKSKLIDIDLLAQASPQWPNFTTDYRPLLEFCREKNLPVICTNVPRRYASLVSIHGDSILYKLSDKAKSYLPNLPILFNFSEASYLECAETAKAGAMNAIRKGTVENLVKAQAVKDATMAHWINKGLTGKNILFHINGEFHSGNHSGICYYLHMFNPDVRIKTISVISLDDGQKLTSKDMRADFMIVVPSDMTKGGM